MCVRAFETLSTENNMNNWELMAQSSPDRGEWLETNGLGGYASSTITGANTRRYHGLLVAATKPPVGRTVLLSKFEETLIVDGKHYDLSTNYYPGAVHPQGFSFLTTFRLDPFPIFTFVVGGIEMEKSVFMPYGENTVVVQWKITKFHGAHEDQIKIEVRPLVAFRDFHALTRENQVANTHLGEGGDLVSLRLYDVWPTLHFAHDAISLDPNGCWYKDFEYPTERERGLEFQEDLYNPCRFDFYLSKKNPVATIIASTEKYAAKDAELLKKSEIARRKKLLAKTAIGEPTLSQLTLAADQFIVRRDVAKSVIAGYHWFCDWGRDTMISLPGLTLATGRLEDARSILTTFVASVDQGLLPNRFSDYGEAPEFNTVDATLWMFHAVHQYFESDGDRDFVRKLLYPKLINVIDHHVQGTRHNIRMDVDGLLQAGEPGAQLTWMDAKIGDWVVTPRIGKPVEIQALWYNALRVMESFAKEFGDKQNTTRFASMAMTVSASFEESFWNADAGCLFDVVGNAIQDAAIRPNQIFAVSLPFPILNGDRAKSVVSVVERELLTPYGLRTLSPNDKGYKGTYGGDMVERDSAYHQGTVWPWLIGAYIDALLLVEGVNKDSVAKAESALQPLAIYSLTTGLGQLPEVFSGDIPHAPGGCIAQAWSVAEVLRSIGKLRSAKKSISIEAKRI